MSAWFQLVVAGLLEVAWALGLKYSQGFTRPGPSVATALALGGSMWLLASAARTIPLGTAYAIWVGIGALGTAALGAALFHESLGVARAICLVVLVGAIVGLKLTAGPAATP